jgi:hypothetical protein
MGRQMLGDSKRSEVVSTRLTKDQREELEKVYGKAGDGVHALVLAWYGDRKRK